MSDHATGRTDAAVPDPSVSRPWIGAIPTVAAAVAVGALGDPVAVVAAGLVVLAWVWASTIAAFAVGQIGLAAAAGTATPSSVVLAQAALGALLFVPAVRAQRSIRHVVATAVAVGGLGAVVAGAWVATGVVWAAAGVAVGVTAVVAYLLHRYGLLTLGELSDE